MDWQQVIADPLRQLMSQLAVFLMKFFGSILIFLVGWVLAGLLRRCLVQVFRAMGLERLAEKAKLSDVLRRGEIRLTFVELLGQLAYWLVLIATAIIALQFMGLTAATDWLQRLGLFIPRLVIGIAVLLFGTLLASFLGATVRAASLNAGFPHGHLLGRAVHTTVVIVAVIVSLEQLQVVTPTIQAALYILLATFGLAFALALGLGSQEFVKRFLENLIWEQRKSNRP